MKFTSNNSLRSKFFIPLLLTLLWSVPTFGGSPEATPSPECKAAVKQVDSVESDVDAAFESLGHAMEKMRRSLKDERRVVEGYLKALGSSGKLPSNEPLKSARAVMKRAHEKELSAQSRLKKAMQKYDQRVKDAIARCGGPR